MNCKPMSCNPLNVKSNTIAILGFISKIEMAPGLNKMPFGLHLTTLRAEMANGLKKMPFGLHKLGGNRIFEDPVLSAICEQ